MATTSGGSTNPALTTAIPHGPDCKLHQSLLSDRCNATTTRNLDCRRRPDRSRFQPDMLPSDILPVCKQHKDMQIRVGKCHAIADCGRRCNRLVKYSPPFHLCSEHTNGTRTLPCYLLDLPPELRDMIWCYALPETISTPTLYGSGERAQRSIFSLLRVNRRISKEVQSVVYGQLPFDVFIGADCIRVCGRFYDTNPKTYNKPQGRSLFDLQIPRREDVSPVLSRIRNFNITMELIGVQYGTYGRFDIGTKEGPQAITHEDYSVFQTRDNLKKFFDMIRRKSLAQAAEKEAGNTIRGLNLRLCLSRGFDWRLDEVMAMAVMAAEPFKALGGIQEPNLHDILSLPTSMSYTDSDLERFKAEYQVYKAEWQTGMLQSAGAASPAFMGPPQSRIDQCKKELRKIEDLITLLHNEGLTVFGLYSSSDDQSSRSLDNIARVVHLARVASEQWDLDNLARIRDVLITRWADFQKKKQHEFNRVTSSFLNLFEGVDPTEAFLERSKELTPAMEDPPEINFDPEWPELSVPGFFSERVSKIPEGATCTEDREYRYFHKDGKFCGAVLKTPFFVRANRRDANL